MCSGKEGIINRNNVCILIKLTFMATYFGWCISEPSSGNKIQKENRTCVIYFCFKRSQLGAHYFLVYLFQLLYVLGNYVLSGLVSRPDQRATHRERKIPVSHIYSRFS